MLSKLETTVMSVGGSIVINEKGFDIDYLTELKRFANDYFKEVDKRLAVVIGGGKTARDPQKSARIINPDLTEEDLDWIGIYATKFNAQVIAKFFKGYASPEIIIDPTKGVNWEYPIVFAAGWLPGCSTDYDAVLLAKNLGSKKKWLI